MYLKFSYLAYCHLSAYKFNRFHSLFLNLSGASDESLRSIKIRVYK
ncbi:hypothetical protein P3J6_121658 [Pseudoalteromonas sp. 3J6]|nr:hypothetical protein PUND_a0867 [Pseudoalteromonas undina]CAD2225830.1 hypothetical protein P3J6_121658 [Pseudoalteromonas sp. 3J6]